MIKDLSDELKSWGHMSGEGGAIILKCDGEPAICAVRDALAKLHGGKVIPEQPPKGESQSNGTIEEAGKTIREFMRVLKDQMEEGAQMKISQDDVVNLWLVRWSAMNVSRFLVGKDGRTAYERRRGRRCKIPLAMFGEKVWYKQLMEGKAKVDKFESEWQEGIWLGHSRKSNETLVGTDAGQSLRHQEAGRGKPMGWEDDTVDERNTPAARPK